MNIRCKWDALREVAAISHFDPVRVICQNKYPPGLALLRFPVMAPLVDLRPGTPLISPAEKWAALIMSHAALLATVWLILATAGLAGVPAWAANFSALVFVFGTVLFHYATFDTAGVREHLGRRRAPGSLRL